MKYYAIKKGRKSNIVVDSWEECKALVFGYPSEYLSFTTKEDAYTWLGKRKLEDIKTEIETILIASNLSISNNRLIDKQTGEFIELTF